MVQINLAIRFAQNIISQGKCQLLNTEETMASEECDLITFKYNKLTSNSDGINLSSLLLNGWIYLIDMFKSHYSLPIESKKLSYNLDELNPILIFEFAELPYFHVQVTSSNP